MTAIKTTASERCLRLRPGDTVGLVTRPLPAGTDVLAGDLLVRLRDDVPAGHKVALMDVPEGGEVRKYGQVIGVATRPISTGEHIHSHNLAFADFERDYAFGEGAKGKPEPPAVQDTFNGIIRDDGRVATRNYIGILTSVNCSATVAKMVANQFFPGSELLAAYPNVDGVVALTHGSGCGMAGSGEGFDLLRRTLTGYARHPNFAGVLVLGLGCEVNQVRALTEGFDLPSSKPLLSMTIQELGGTRATVREATARARDIAEEANNVRRVPVPVSELILGLECGGSDGYSGITANPALGAAADLLVQQGGTAVLGETPEIYGAEHLLTRRAASREVGERLVERIHWWEQYVKSCGASLDNNPSPGNKEGGLTTILEKSLGAVAKGGSCDLERGVRVRRAGDRQGLCVHGHSRLRPGLSHRDGRRGGKRRLFHDRAGVRFRLQACTVPEAVHEQRDLRAHVRGHGRQLRGDRRRHDDRGADRSADLRPRGGRGVGAAVQERGARLRRRRVHPLAARGRALAAIHLEVSHLEVSHLEVSHLEVSHLEVSHLADRLFQAPKAWPRRAPSTKQTRKPTHRYVDTVKNTKWILTVLELSDTKVIPYTRQTAATMMRAQGRPSLRLERLDAEVGERDVVVGLGCASAILDELRSPRVASSLRPGIWRQLSPCC